MPPSIYHSPEVEAYAHQALPVTVDTCHTEALTRKVSGRPAEKSHEHNKGTGQYQELLMSVYGSVGWSQCRCVRLEHSAEYTYRRLSAKRYRNIRQHVQKRS
jgi:hypothetical protein